VPLDELEDLPTLIVCSRVLVPNWNDEATRFLQQGAFDTFKYVGNDKERDEFWREKFGKCKTPFGRRIVMASVEVCVRYFS
jgi:SNF2 family DNA or RNA helicase